MREYAGMRDEKGEYKHGYSHRSPARVWPSCFIQNKDGTFERVNEEKALTLGTHIGPVRVWFSLVEDFHPLHVPEDEQMVLRRDGQEFVARQNDQEIFRNQYLPVVLEFAMQKLRSPYSLDARVPVSYAVALTHLSDKELRGEYKRDLAHGGYHQSEIKSEMDTRGHVKRGGIRERLARIKFLKRERGGRGRRDR
jgi:hypothetical protein